uniref:Histone deacetylase 11 n=1 Tax=Taeniopygia guttata TaxID=59729 RepID=A0A674GWC2_TAEGU
YSPDYNITFMGLEKLHPFDAGKWGKVINFLKEEKLIADDLIVQAREATDEDLLVVHTRRYLNKLKVMCVGVLWSVCWGEVPASLSDTAWIRGIWRESKVWCKDITKHIPCCEGFQSQLTQDHGGEEHSVYISKGNVHLFNFDVTLKHKHVRFLVLNLSSHLWVELGSR